LLVVDVAQQPCEATTTKGDGWVQEGRKQEAGAMASENTHKSAEEGMQQLI